MNQYYQIENQAKETDDNKRIGLRNKIIGFLIAFLIVVVIGLIIFFVNGGNVDILADRANYVAQQPGQATSNVIQYGQVKGKSGQICGIVADFSGQILSGAKVEIINSRINWSTQTDQTGQYCIPPHNSNAISVLGEVLIGEYQLKASIDGYYPQVITTTVDTGQRKEANFSLTSVKDDLLPGAY